MSDASTEPGVACAHDITLYELEASLVVCFTGQSRASAIIQDQIKAATKSDEDALRAMHQLKADAIDMKQALLRGNIQEVAEILNRSFYVKLFFIIEDLGL